nr:MAG TPA: hypothetical protein [Caudoviricetes sp.]
MFCGISPLLNSAKIHTKGGGGLETKRHWRC